MMPTQRPLNPYIVFEGDPYEGAVLVFAHNAREAKRLGYPEVLSWTLGHYLDVSVRRLRGDYSHHAVSTEPHVVYPHGCDRCDLWSDEPLVDGVHPSCRDGGTDA